MCDKLWWSLCGRDAVDGSQIERDEKGRSFLWTVRTLHGFSQNKKGILGGKLFQLLINSVSKNLVVVYHTVLLPPRLIKKKRKKKKKKSPILMILSPAPQVPSVDQHH